jgi:hypothetical protein
VHRACHRCKKYYSSVAQIGSDSRIRGKGRGAHRWRERERERERAFLVAKKREEK